MVHRNSAIALSCEHSTERARASESVVALVIGTICIYGCASQVGWRASLAHVWACLIGALVALIPVLTAALRASGLQIAKMSLRAFAPVAAVSVLTVVTILGSTRAEARHDRVMAARAAAEAARPPCTTRPTGGNQPKYPPLPRAGDF